MKFKRLVLISLLYTLLVVVWGAWVRISKSGDGCGDHWPLCKGEFLPDSDVVATWIEYAHRASSGIYGFVILAMVIWAFKLYPKKHWARKVAVASLFFTFTEAFLGAKLVLVGLVAQNDSPYRATMMSLHLVNSLLLTGSLTLLWDISLSTRLSFKKPRKVLQAASVFGVLGFFLIGMSGAIAALATTLFPSESLLSGLQADVAPNAHFLVRLRIWHPILALCIGSSLVTLAWWSKEQLPEFKKRATGLLHGLLTGIVFGVLTLMFLSPVWMKLVHLSLAHLIWILFLLYLSQIWIKKED